MTYAFRDWLNVENRPDLRPIRHKVVGDTYRDFRFSDLVRIACGMPDRAMPSARAWQSLGTGKSPFAALSRAIAIAARCVGLCVMLGCVWLIVSGAL